MIKARPANRRTGSRHAQGVIYRNSRVPRQGTPDDNCNRAQPASRGLRADSFRIDEDDWDDRGGVAESTERDRGWWQRKLVAWYLDRPSAELPDHPGRK